MTRCWLCTSSSNALIVNVDVAIARVLPIRILLAGAHQSRLLRWSL
jgi:hypothetical protein